MPVGGSSEALLAFGPLPESSTILRALLVLHPHERGARLLETTEVVVEDVGPFRGGALPARHGAQPTDFAAARRLVPAGPPRPVRLDVTDAAHGAGAGSLHLLVRSGGDEALLFASPWVGDESARPRLELMVR